MTKILIKKRVPLDFLGDEYKDAYLVFRSMPISDFEKFQEEASAVEDKKSVSFLLDKLKQNFVSGEFPVDGKLVAIEKEDLDDFDAETIVKAFQTYTGVKQDPKD